MTHPKTLATAAALLAGALSLSACSSGSGSGQSTGSATSPSTTAGSTTTSAPAAAVTTGTATAAAGPHNQADVTFATEMIPHHEQAVEMSDILLGKAGIDAKVTDLAKEIKAAQAPEIAQMRGWLAGWDTSSSSPDSGPRSGPGSGPMSGPGSGPMSGPGSGHMSGPGGGHMSGPGGGHMSCMGHDCMGGMMSEADMAAFRAATGADAQRKFLTGMIKHHEGAVVMAQTELAQGQNPTAKQLAQAIIDAQKAEIAQMQKMLTG